MLSINMDDLMNVVNSCKSYLIGILVALGLAIIVTIAVMKMKKAQRKLIRAEAWIAALLAIVVLVNGICFGPMNTMIRLATGSGTIKDDTAEASKALCTEIAEEGIILLENKDQTLPLENGKKINVFGWSSTNPVYGGTGSGSVSDAYHKVDLIEGLENAGFQVNSELTDFYRNYKDTRPSITLLDQDWTLPEPALSAYSDDLMANAEEFSDTALFVVSRPGGENADIPTDMPAVVDGSWKDQDANTGYTYFNGTYDDSMNDGNDWEAGQHYLELDVRERELLEDLCTRFANVIVVANSNNTMELGFARQYPQVKGLIWCAGAGQSGFDALGEILSGSVNPSGKTVDTFVEDLTATPYYNSIHLNEYDNMQDYAAITTTWYKEGDVTIIPEFTNYVEGIYVGYRFYETAAKEGLINYDEVVSYPFGYGLSYTTFEQKIENVRTDEENISFDVVVTNTGKTVGKDVVQVYFDPPYNNGGIEKASANLVAFAKSDLLEAGQSQTIPITFKAEDMASFDAYKNQCYVLEGGDYEISVNFSSHEKLDSFIYQVKSDVVYGEGNSRSSDKTTAVDQLQFAEGDVTYLSRADQFANYAEATAAPTVFSMSDAQKATFINNDHYNPDDYNDASDTMPVTGAKNGMKLADLRGADYDDSNWDMLLDQMSVSDMDTLIALAGYQTNPIESIGKVATLDCDGPASINNNFTGEASIGFPSGVMIAATWNTDLGYAFGESIGMMADEMDVSGWYAPAMNGHRSAFAGRNFEYYSEDGLLAGKIAAQALLGAESHGVYGYIKHFALNDQELGRCSMLCTWSTEQAIREIYLKPFEICVKEGGAKAVMSSFNYIGTRWASATPELQRTILRDEWGFKGFVLTDYFGVYGYMDADQAIRNGTDACLVNYDTETNHVTDTTSATGVIAMRQASKNILYTVVNSRAYEDDNLNPGMEPWKKTAIVIDVILGLLLAALQFLAVKKYLKRKKENA